MSSASINSDSTIISITFNTTITFTGTWKKDDWRVEMFLPNKEPIIDFNYTVTGGGDSSDATIQLEYDQQLFGFNMEYVVLTFIDRFTTVDTTYSLELIDTQYTFYLEGKEISSNASSLEMYGTITLSIFIFCSIIMCISGCFGYKAAIILDIFSTLQLIHLFPIGRFYMPTGLFKFFKTFEILNFQGLNFGIWDFDKASTKGLLTVHGDIVNYNFEKMGFTTSSFIFTSIDVIISIIYMLFIPISIRILAQIFRKSTLIRYLDAVIITNILPFIINSTVFILSFTALLNVKEFNVETESESFGSIASFGYFVFISMFIGIFVLLVGYFWWYLRMAKKDLNSEDRDLRKTTIIGKYFVAPYRTAHLYHYFYPLTQILRRIMVASVFVLYKNDGFLQLLLLSFISGLNLVYHTSYQPFDHKMRNIVITILEFAYLTICMTIFPYVYPNLEDDLFINQAFLVVRLFLFIFIIA